MTTPHSPAGIEHPAITRRGLVQAGAAGAMGLGMGQLDALRALAGSDAEPARAKSVIFIFAVGGMSQHETFDMKPVAPDSIRGEFQPIATQTRGSTSPHLQRQTDHETDSRLTAR